jgi:hypothetical protein
MPGDSRPHANTYWVLPGRLLAGEYPGAKDPPEAAAKVGRMLDSGIDVFIDLTVAGELVPYDGVLGAEATKRGRMVVHRRFPIRDLGVPADRSTMAGILDAIDAALAAGRTVYVHCWGGVGRTGTVVACHLIRHGFAPDAALQRLGELFSTMRKAPLRRSPETPAQLAFVRSWSESLTQLPGGGRSQADRATVARALDAVAIGVPRSWRGLTVFPLHATSPGSRAYDTVGEAIAHGTFQVAEVSESGTVPNLRATNVGTRPVLILDGEELIGAKQNRVVNITIVVPAGATLDIPVSCVEVGRWSYSSREFGESGRALFAERRARSMREVTESLRSGRGARADQGAVWNDVALRLGDLAAPSPTGAMGAAYDRHGESIEGYVAAFEAEPAQVGAIFGVRGRVAGLELFDDPDTFRLSLPKLLRSYALELLNAPSQLDVNAAEAEALLAAVKRAAPSRHEALGGGIDLRFDGDGLTGAALLVNEEVVHLSVYSLAGLGGERGG